MAVPWWPCVASCCSIIWQLSQVASRPIQKQCCRGVRGTVDPGRCYLRRQQQRKEIPSRRFQRGIGRVGWRQSPAYPSKSRASTGLDMRGRRAMTTGAATALLRTPYYLRCRPALVYRLDTPTHTALNHPSL